jgi:Skp family chaperone for outer membrane proteins
MKALSDREKSIQKEEKDIINQKKVISAEEYKKKVISLRSKVSTLQKDRKALITRVSKKRSKAKSELLKNLNPIIKEYMKEKKIRYVMDKKSLILADENLDITQDIIKILNDKLKTIKLN